MRANIDNPISAEAVQSQANDGTRYEWVDVQFTGGKLSIWLPVGTAQPVADAINAALGVSK